MMKKLPLLLLLGLTQGHADNYIKVELTPPYKVEIYSAIFCGYCEKVKSRLEQSGIVYTEHGTIFSSGNRNQMLERTNGEDGVPRIFINDHYIGGYREFNSISQDRLDLLASEQPVYVRVKNKNRLPE